MIRRAFLFLIFVLLSGSVLAVSQSDINVINRINSNENIIISDTVSNIVFSRDNLISVNQPDVISDSDIVNVLPEKTSGIVYADDAKLEVNDSNIDLNNVGLGKGIIAIAGDNISGNFTVTFYTNMPNTPFSIKHYEGITDDKTLVQTEGETLIPLIYSDEFGVVSYNSSNFSTQILSFPNPLVHPAGGATTTYYLDYFFNNYDFVTFTQSGNFTINDSFSNYVSYESTYPTENYIEYQDNLIDTYFQGNNKRVRLVSKNYTNGFTKSVTIKAANDASHSGEVTQTFTWKLNATPNPIANQYPIQKANIPNITITKNNRKTLFFNDYYSNYSDIYIVVYNTSNYSQSTKGFGQQITVNTTLYSYASITNSSIFLIDLNGLGNDIASAIYTNNTDNVTLDVWYTAGLKNSSGSYNLLNISNFFLTISGNYPTTQYNCTNINNTYYSGKTMSNTGSDTSYAGIAFRFNTTGIIKKIYKSSASNDANCKVFDVAANAWIPTTGSFSSDTCVLDFNVEAGKTYYLVGNPTSTQAYGSASDFSSPVITNIGNFTNGVTCQSTTVCTNAIVDGYSRHITGFEFQTNGTCTLVYSAPIQIASLPNINIYQDDMVYLDYNDYYTGFDRVYINFTLQNNTKVSMFALLNASSYKVSSTGYYTLNLTGNSYSMRLYITADINSSSTLFNVSICNNTTCIYVPQYLNISVRPITDIPQQINHIDNIFMQKNQTITFNWGAYFTGYTALSISFIDLISGNNVTILYYNNTTNFTTSYLNITSFLNGLDVNTTFQSFDTEYHTVMLIDAINAYGDVGQYVNFNINYSAVVTPPETNQTVERCKELNTICIFPDYTAQTQHQMNVYVILSLIVTAILLGVVSMSLSGEVGMIYIIITGLVIVFELIYFARIKYLPITYIVGITVTCVIGLYLLYKKVTS